MTDYIRLPDEFFTSSTMKELRAEDNGAEATVIYLKLALMQKFAEGSTGTREGLATIAEAIDEEPSAFKKALETLENYCLVDPMIDGDDVFISVTMPEDVD